MKRKSVIALLCLAVAGLALCLPAQAGEVDCDAVYCFTPEDFSQEPLRGICITGLPRVSTGTVRLGSRILQVGDILTGEQVAQMTFCPLRCDTDQTAQVSYLPIYENRVEKDHTVAISIHGKEDKAPVAQDSAMETYKNIPNEGCLKAEDPEGKELTYTLIRQPKRGQVELRENGTFLYTPKKNKVGVDSFVFTATDPAGNVSRQATVTVQILKPSDARQYTDTAGQACRFTAEWLRHTGLFAGESYGGNLCFCPEKAVTRGQFLAMLSETLGLKAEETDLTAVSETAPQWLKPYLAVALRSGLTEGLPEESRDMDGIVTGGEAAVMIQNALDLTVSRETLEAGMQEPVPAWAQASLLAMADAGIPVTGTEVLTRGEAAQILYQVYRVAPTAAGTSVFRLQ